MPAKKKVTSKKKVSKKVVKTKKKAGLIPSPDEFQIAGGINSAVDKAKSLLESIKPNQEGVMVIFYSEDGTIKDGVLSVSGPKGDIINQILLIMKKCDLNPVEVISQYVKYIQP